MTDGRIGMALSRLTPGAEQNILALNAAHEAETSPLTREELHRLVGESYHLGLAGKDGSSGFLVALDETSAHRGVNYLWFKTRYDRFVYIDRVVVSPAERGRGVGRELYRALFEHAAETGHDTVGCEVNLDPPNPGSDAFHEALGFREIGRAKLVHNGKTVRYLGRYRR